MTRAPRNTRQFEKDVERVRRRQRDVTKLRAVMSKLVAGEPLDEKHHDHALIGEYRGRRECHIEPDWLLIYLLSENWITFERTGTHADLFE